MMSSPSVAITAYKLRLSQRVESRETQAPIDAEDPVGASPRFRTAMMQGKFML